MQVPQSANDDTPPQRPLPPVDPKFLLMAAAGMQQRAYEADATFSNAEMSKNLEDRRSWGDMENLAASIGVALAAQQRQSKTPPGYDTATTPTKGDEGDFEIRGLSRTPDEQLGPMGRMNLGTTPR
jgi:hypothetical protein